MKMINLSLWMAGLTLSTLVVWQAATGAPVPERGNSAPVSPEEIRFEVPLVNPIETDEEPLLYPIYLRVDERGFPQEYRMPLTANICPEGVCKVLEIVLYWDPLGHHTRHEYPPGVSPLTKYDDDPFTADDYQKLSATLKDKSSVLGHYPLNAVVHPTDPVYGDDEVDGVSGATAMTFVDVVVPGAAYTFWALWQWVNGDVVEALEEKTRSFLHGDYLVYSLESSDTRKVEFALRHLQDQPGGGQPYAEVLVNMLETGGWGVSQLALDALTADLSDPERIHQKLIKAIGKNPGSSDLIIRYFEQMDDAPPYVWAQMAEQLARLNDFMDLHRVLRLLERRIGRSKTMVRSMEALQDHPDISIAQRAKMFVDAAR